MCGGQLLIRKFIGKYLLFIGLNDVTNVELAICYPAAYKHQRFSMLLNMKLNCCNWGMVGLELDHLQIVSSDVT